MDAVRIFGEGPLNRFRSIRSDRCSCRTQAGEGPYSANLQVLFLAMTIGTPISLMPRERVLPSIALAANLSIGRGRAKCIFINLEFPWTNEAPRYPKQWPFNGTLADATPLRIRKQPHRQPVKLTKPPTGSGWITTMVLRLGRGPVNGVADLTSTTLSKSS